MKKVVSYFFAEYNLSRQTLKFKQLLYLFIAIKAAYWLFYYQLFFGENAIAYIRPYSLGTMKNIAFLLYNNSSTNAGYFFIIGLLGFLTLSYFIRKIPFLLEFIIWILVLNIQNKIYPTLTGGDYLLNQFLFFNCFLSKSNITNLTWENALSKCFHNFGVTAIIIQINLVYLIAAIAKLNSSDWLNGVAIIKLNYVDYYNLFSNSISTNNFVDYFINYLVLFYQLFFPVIFWINKIKVPFLILGILIHLYIALIMGLVGFGLIMIIAYVFFWPFKKTVS
ncbi:HTTM domain-containing protein [Sediminibacterium sp.]|uniref:HTTM domain-containing protein n=1 Tax=Sediminibacterium sp. TaxID=1917865 RepID=UPI002736D377|nr:hypothetical protein [Sediminibacterium sp.]MDP3567305.1 hypothetical protein [Sediminibacterium sp.]